MLMFKKRPYLSAFVGIYVLLLIFSAIVQTVFPAVEKKHLYSVEETYLVDDFRISAEYFYLPNPESNRNIIILPDQILGSAFLMPLAEQLQQDSNIYMIQYPEEDADGKRISMSVESRAAMLGSFVDARQLENAHLVGHGYGGLIAVHYLSEFGITSAVKSLALLSSYGPVELHLLGNETINRYMYGSLYPASFVFNYLMPHFGWFDRQALQNKNIRAFREMNQAGFREQAESAQLPVHLLHPLNDNYVSYQTSLEIHRIIPQSTFAVSDVYKEKIFDRPDFWTEQLQWFWVSVEEGSAKTRSMASAERLRQAELPFDTEAVSSHSGWALVVILFVIIVLSFLNEDLTCISAGLLVAGGILDLHFAIAACFIGIFCTDAAAYYLGSRVGKPIFDKVPFKWIVDESDIDRVENLLKMHGMKIIFITRFLPGTRLPTYIAAGMLKTDFKKFLIYFILAITVWAPLIVSLSAVLGRPMLGYIETYQEYALWIVLGIVLIIYSLLKLVLPLATITGRRRFIVKFGRFRERYFGSS